MDTLSKLEGQTTDQTTPFGAYEEEAIISLALDHPEFWTSVGRFLKPNMFGRLECRLVAAEILNSFEKFDIVPTRKILRDRIIASLTEDHPYDEILRIVDRKSDYREVPLIKDTLLKWAKDRAFGQIYSEEAQQAYARGDYQFLEKIINEANRIADVSSNGFWFFENYQLLFEPNVIDHRTTGFPKLDKMLNNGGPSPKEVCCWLAPTNVGKCHTLQSKIIEKNLSRVYEIEFENGKIIKLAGFEKIQTTRGLIKVCDLTDGDDILQIPIETDGVDEVPSLWICGR